MFSPPGSLLKFIQTHALYEYIYIINTHTFHRRKMWKKRKWYCIIDKKKTEKWFIEHAYFAHN